MKKIFNPLNSKIFGSITGTMIVLTFLFSANFLHAAPIDFFDTDYQPTIFSKTEIVGPEVFFATIKAKATVAEDLPKPIVDLRYTYRYFATNNDTGEEVVLNPKFVGDKITPFPMKVGESYTGTQKVPLQFPDGGKKGEYTVYEQVIYTEITKPAAPTAPTKPTEPTKPSEPIQPSAPDGSAPGTEPSKPSEPNRPPEPEQPSGPPMPVDDFDPNEPLEPREMGTVTYTPSQVATTPTIESLVLSQDTLISGETAIGTVTLSGPAPVRGQPVRLSASPRISVSLPIILRIKAGATTGTFKIRAKKVSAPKKLIVKASLKDSSKTAPLTVSPASEWACGDSMTDSRDGKIYSTVQIGAQCWMSQNLNVGTRINSCSNGFVGTCANTTPKQTTTKQGTSCSEIKKFCFNDDEGKCDQYGALYEADQASCGSIVDGAQGICPAGWHVPTDAEWFALENGLTDEGQTCDPKRNFSWDCASASTKLKAGGSSGFEAILLGTRSTTGGYFTRFNQYKDGAYTLRNQRTGYWSSTGTAYQKISRFLDANDPTVMRMNENVREGYFVRCLKDAGAPGKATLSSLTVLPNSVNSSEVAEGTVTLTQAAPAGGQDVLISISRPDAASANPIVKVPAGEISATFKIISAAIVTQGPIDPIKVVLTAQIAEVKKTATLTVVVPSHEDPLAVDSLSVVPASLSSGEKALGTVTLNREASGEGVEVQLTASPSNVLAIPLSTSVKAGSKSSSFEIQTKSVTMATDVKITAKLGTFSQSAMLKVMPPAPVGVLGLTLSPDSVAIETSSTGTVTLTGPAPMGGVMVQLTANYPTTLSMPSTVPVAAGSKTGTFKLQSKWVDAPKEVMITAKLFQSSATVLSQKTTVLKINPPVKVSSLALSTTSISSLVSVTGTVTLSGPAPEGGQVVDLSAFPASLVTVPNQVTVAAGETKKTFGVMPKLIPPLPEGVTITAKANNTTKTATLTLVPSFAPTRCPYTCREDACSDTEVEDNRISCPSYQYTYSCGTYFSPKTCYGTKTPRCCKPKYQ